MKNSLEIELKTFEDLKPSLLVQEGEYAIVHGTELIGVYGTYEDALKVGYERCGLDPFLVKKIQSIEQVNFFSRPIYDLCPI